MNLLRAASTISLLTLASRITGLVPDWVLRITLALVLFWAAYSLVNPLRH